MSCDISKTSTVVIAKDSIWCDALGEAVILNLQSGVYYGLNEVGAKIWNLIQTPTKVRVVLKKLVEEYDVEPDLCESDLVELLKELKFRNLIEVESVNDAFDK
jgi:coenzyme PQQ synthesis protein D (PqqD)